MDYDVILHTFELPKTPASTTDGHGYDSGDDVERTGEYSHGVHKQQATNIMIANNTVKPINVPQMIATPPQSPPYSSGMPPLMPAPSGSGGSMPLLSQLLSNPNFTAPPGYVVCVPCYLCKKPFNNIDRLKEHLVMHASMIQANAAASRTRKEQQPETDRRHQQEKILLYSCEYCGKLVNSKYKLGYHLRNFHRGSDAQNMPKEQLHQCQSCKKIYKRKTSMHLHMKVKHGVTIISNILPSSESNSTETNSLEPQRQIWSTNLLNAFAAAQYNPARESAEKYMISSPEPRQQHHPGFKPKQKYPLRSPFFNPNLWLDAASYI